MFNLFKEISQKLFKEISHKTFIVFEKLNKRGFGVHCSIQWYPPYVVVERCFFFKQVVLMELLMERLSMTATVGQCIKENFVSDGLMTYDLDQGSR
jgi:hypothetical protein